MGKKITTDINFDSLPLWQGVKSRPGIEHLFPLNIGWDMRGFICQITHKAVRDKVIDSYSSEDYQFITPPPGCSVWSNKLGDQLIQYIVNMVEDYDVSSVLDIGAGSLYVPEKLMNHFELQKYVIMDPAINQLSENKGIHVVRDYFQVDLCRDKKFDLVIALNVLEHVDDPFLFLSDINQLLLPCQGRAIFVFPDIENGFVNGDYNVLIHEHMSYFTNNTATRLLENCGFRILKKQRKFEDLVFYVEAISKPCNYVRYPKDPLLLTGTNKFVYNLENTRERIEVFIQRGESIAMHGASNGLNIFFYLADISKSDNVMVFDGDDKKVGSYLPACDNIIRSLDDNRYSDVDRVFVSTPAFYNEIKESVVLRHGVHEYRVEHLFPV